MTERYLISTCQACSTPNTNLIGSFKLYCKENQSKVIYLPTIGQSASEDWRDLDHYFENQDVEYGQRKLNSNIQIAQFNVRPYQIDPTTGLDRFAQSSTTQVFASPKQRLKPIAHSNLKFPKFLVTTGAVTNPNYATGEDKSAERRRLGDIAKRDHLYGALVVEIENDDYFHIRHITATKTGEFIDLGIKYTPNGIKKAKLEALVLGDYHVGFTEPNIEKISHQIIDLFEPERLILHDFFNGASVSHHCEKMPYEQKLIQIIDKGLHKLDFELELCYNTLIKLNELMKGKPIYLVHSNHHEFLNRYLEEARHLRDYVNFRTANKLLTFMAEMDYNNPVEEGIKMIGKIPKNIHFLKPDADLKVRGYQLGAHGDKGPSGGRGSIQTKENDWGKSITGHVHSAETLRNTHTVGTMLPRNMYYMRGYPSKSTNTHGLLWDNGSVQLLNIINGKFTI